MWACLHDRRNAKSSPDHYNMPCVHNLHEIHIHSWHACTRNSFFLLLPDSLMLSLSLCAPLGCVLFRKSFKWKHWYHQCLSFLTKLPVLPFILLFILPITALRSHHVVCCGSKKEYNSRSFEKKKRRGSTSFVSVRESKREGNVSLAPML